MFNPYSIEVRHCPYMVHDEQIVFPKTDKKRMRKKFTKNRNNWASVPDKHYYIIGNVVYGHPSSLYKALYDASVQAI